MSDEVHVLPLPSLLSREIAKAYRNELLELKCWALADRGAIRQLLQTIEEEYELRSMAELERRVFEADRLG